MVGHIEQTCNNIFAGISLCALASKNIYAEVIEVIRNIKNLIRETEIYNESQFAKDVIERFLFCFREHVIISSLIQMLDKVYLNSVISEYELLELYNEHKYELKLDTFDKSKVITAIKEVFEKVGVELLSMVGFSQESLVKGLILIDSLVRYKYNGPFSITKLFKQFKNSVQNQFSRSCLNTLFAECLDSDEQYLDKNKAVLQRLIELVDREVFDEYPYNDFELCKDLYVNCIDEIEQAFNDYKQRYDLESIVLGSDQPIYVSIIQIVASDIVNQFADFVIITYSKFIPELNDTSSRLTALEIIEEKLFK